MLLPFCVFRHLPRSAITIAMSGCEKCKGRGKGKGESMQVNKEIVLEVIKAAGVSDFADVVVKNKTVTKYGAKAK